MNPRKIAVVAGILAGSVVLLLSMHHDGHTDKKASEAALLLFKDFQKKNCSEMLFIERSDTARLKRKGRIWNLVTPCIPVVPATSPNIRGALFPEYPVDSALLANALETAGEIEREELVSVNAGKQTELQVDGAGALLFECRDSTGSSLGRIYIGETGPRAGSSFVRMNESDSVYLTGGSVRSALFANAKRWADKAIVKFDKNLAVKITIVSADSGTVELEKRALTPVSGNDARDCWYLVKPVPALANQDRVASLLSNMSSLRAADFEGDAKLPEKAMGFDRPATATTVTLSDGTSRTVIVGGKDKAAMKWIRNPEKPGVTFTVYGYTLAGFNPGTAYFKDTAARDTLSPVDAAKSAIAKQIQGSIKNPERAILNAVKGIPK
jgi:hypothetical protein